jgi:hypothetical protein
VRQQHDSAWRLRTLPKHLLARFGLRRHLAEHMGASSRRGSKICYSAAAPPVSMRIGSVVFKQDRLPEKARRFSLRVTHINADVTQEIGLVLEVLL